MLYHIEEDLNFGPSAPISLSLSEFQDTGRFQGTYLISLWECSSKASSISFICPSTLAPPLASLLLFEVNIHSGPKFKHSASFSPSWARDALFPASLLHIHTHLSLAQIPPPCPHPHNHFSGPTQKSRSYILLIRKTQQTDIQWVKKLAGSKLELRFLNPVVLNSKLHALS